MGLLSRRRLLRLDPLQRAALETTETGLDGLPAVHGARQVWVVPDEPAHMAVLARVAEHVATHRPVLLVAAEPCLRAVQAQVEAPSIAWLSTARPTVKQVLLAARPLARMGRPLLLVHGSTSLEQASEEETPDAVVRELIEECPDDMDVLVLELAATPLRLKPTYRG